VAHTDGNGWVTCDQGHRHWGRHGAAGLLLRHGSPPKIRVLLQHRAEWTHHGGTWSIPGGARDSHETAVQAALRETEEEAGVDPAEVKVNAMIRQEHGRWSYTTVLAEAINEISFRVAATESIELRWVPVEEVTKLPLHPGFAESWPQLRELI
jgi:8-oxo-dGTP pyrophosphatase MutT (NUDIX family)